MEPPRRHRPLDPNRDRQARAALNAHLSQLRRLMAAEQSALLALDRGLVAEVREWLTTAHDQLAAIGADLERVRAEIDALQPDNPSS
jgi:hypothetical protein